MALIVCKDCKKNISSDVSTCPYCGAIISEEYKQEQLATAKAINFGCGILIVVFIFTILIMISLISNSSSSSSSSTSTEPTEVVYNNPYDFSVYQVVNYLKKSYLKDPDSYQGIEWSKVVKKNGYYFVRHKYRAKNGFGGYNIENQVFIMELDGTVIGLE